MSNRDQKPDLPRPLYEGYQPQAKDPGSPSKPPENPPSQGPVGRKR